MHLVTDIPRDVRLDNVSPWRVGQIIIAALLLVVSIGFIAFLALVSRGLSLRDPEFWEFDRVLLRSVYIWLCISMSFVGLNVIEGRKYTVLYLRRFRSELSAFIAMNIQRGLGRHFRVITLDDGRFPPLEMPRLEKWSSRLLPPLLLLASVVLYALAVHRLSLVSEMGHWVLGLTQVALTFWAVHVWMLLVVALAHRYRVRRRARLGVRSVRDLRKVRYAVWRLQRWRYRSGLMAPQATVVTVCDDLWQAAVEQLTVQVDAVLLDVSEPSDALAWELERISALGSPRVFIGEGTRLEGWALSPVAPGSPNGQRALAGLLSDQHVLSYNSTQDAKAHAFRKSVDRAVRYAVLGKGRRAPSFSPSMRERCGGLVGNLLFYGVTFLLALIAGLALEPVLREWIQGLLPWIRAGI